MHKLSIILALTLLLASCGGGSGGGRSGIDQSSPGAAACHRAMAASTRDYGPASIGSGGSCEVVLPVSFSRSLDLHFTPQLSTSCAMAMAWFDFEPEAEALARSHLGSGIAVVRHYGSYNCRSMSGNRRRMSLHATARALDIAGFVLDNGREISVKRDWRRGDAGRFLDAFANSACERFGVVLTPAHDRAHHDHIHLDIGPWRLCGT
ncbi:MAG: extensin family protein [Geminicoccaceae bacterium]